MDKKNVINHYYMLEQFRLFSIFLLIIFLGSANVLAGGTGVNNVVLTPQDRILILSPHPDDEILGTGGIIQQAVSMKLPIKIVFLTNGDSNQWSFLLYRHHPVVFPAAVENMGLVRHDEALKADGILGVDSKDLIFLGYPDFGTLNMWYYHWNKRPAYRSIMTMVTSVPYKSAWRPGAPYRGDEVLKDLESIFNSFKPTKVFVSHPADHNGDHLALYLYTRVALLETGMDEHVGLYPYLIHYLTWPNPKGFHPEKYLVPPKGLADQENWQQYHLTPAQIQNKRKALQAHWTQFFSSRNYLLSFVKFNELFGDFPMIKLSSHES
ncbi:MAG: PIG-L family deacetylase, partial [Candidatus Omnitrophica bacterium]|nr:PIG-L family deacetylase [Candidatus Omnitrophota bacterium]